MEVRSAVASWEMGSLKNIQKQHPCYGHCYSQNESLQWRPQWGLFKQLPGSGGYTWIGEGSLSQHIVGWVLFLVEWSKPIFPGYLTLGSLCFYCETTKFHWPLSLTVAAGGGVWETALFQTASCLHTLYSTNYFPLTNKTNQSNSNIFFCRSDVIQSQKWPYQCLDFHFHKLLFRLPMKALLLWILGYW